MVLTIIVFICAAILAGLYARLVALSKEFHTEEEVAEVAKRNKRDRILVIIGVIILALLIVASIDIFVHATEPTPETGVIETTESTTAPDETSVSETEETIHIEPSELPSQPSGGSVSGEINIDVPETELEMLACVIYQEAGGDGCCDDCRRRVADVVLNRVEDSRFPNTMRDVLTAYQQYGRFYWTGIVWADRASNPGEKYAVERAYRIAEEVLNGQHSELYGEGYIWQAEFTQGKSGFWHCGTYFGRS